MSTDYAVRSDFLIHWTGFDIDQNLDPNWYSDHRPDLRRSVPTECWNKYKNRLKNILKYGLWMTVEQDVRCGSVILPDTPRTCFTELKISQSRNHANRYGRLGIGFKRPFLFHRFGRPMVYYGFSNDQFKDKYLEACVEELSDKSLLHFFKPMNETAADLNYQLYSESEWRIIFFDQLLKEGKIIDPRDPANTAHNEYFKQLSESEQQKLKYLIPLSSWFSMIIYPSLQLKNDLQNDEEIRRLIAAIKSSRNDPTPTIERANWPIELNLAASGHF